MTSPRSIIQLSTGASLYYYLKDIFFIVEEYFRIEKRRKRNQRLERTNITSKCGRRNSKKAKE